MTARPPRSKQPNPAGAPWEEGGFRETLLRRFPESERQTLRDFGRMLEEYAGELGRYSAASGRNAVRELLLAVAADLRHSRGWLEVLARQRGESELTPEDLRVCEVAAHHTEVLADVARLLAAAAEQPTSETEGA